MIQSPIKHLPNRLTLSRVIISPVFMVLLLMDTSITRWSALGLFIIAAITDLLDGYLARRFKQQTGFGRFMDPVADKLLISMALISFVALKMAQPWVVLLIVGREFLIMGLRSLVAYRGEMMESSFLAKLKTFCQMFSILCILLFICLGQSLAPWDIARIRFSLDFLMLLAMALTLLSGLDYVIKNRWLIAGLFRGNL